MFLKNFNVLLLSSFFISCGQEPQLLKDAEVKKVYSNDVPKGYQQTKDYTCGPASTVTALRYLASKNKLPPNLVLPKNDLDLENLLMKELKTTEKSGTHPIDMINWFLKNNFYVETSLDVASFNKNLLKNSKLSIIKINDDTNSSQTLTSLKYIIDGIKLDKATLVEWIDWGGHWVMFKGYDDKNTLDNFSDDEIIFADPYDITDHNVDGLTMFNAERFYYMWFDALYIKDFTKPELRKKDRGITDKVFINFYYKK